MKFTNKAELIEQAIKDGACDEGIKFAKSCKDLQEIFETIDANMLFWCLTNGYDQFADRYDFEKLDGFDWSRLLSRQPQFADRCDFEKLDYDDLDFLLKSQPQFAKFRK